jgi:hypothetical protein
VSQHTTMPKTRRGGSRGAHVNRLRSPMRGLAGCCACAQPGMAPCAFGTHPRHRSRLPPCLGERAAMTGARRTLPVAAVQAPGTHEAGDDGRVSWSVLSDQSTAAARQAVPCPAAKRLA